MDLIDLFDRGSQWSASKIPGAVDKLDDPTPCDKWDVRTLLDHMLDTLRYFNEVPDKESPDLPSPTPPRIVEDEPLKQYEEAREAVLRAYREPGVVERTGPSLGIAFADQLIHGCDLAKATAQDATMPADLAGAAFQMLNGQLPPERRGDAFKAEVEIPDSASAQEKLLAYTGRQP